LSVAAAELDRAVRKLRSLPVRAWSSAGRREATLSAAVELAEAAQGAEQRGSDSAPDWRALPDLADHALPDVVAVLGADALAALEPLDANTPVWTRRGRAPAGDVLSAVIAALRAAVS
jgi:hypothetical protein